MPIPLTPTDTENYRPSTRGELAKRLKAGETCEVAGHVVEMTSLMLKYWLGCEDFTVVPSPNPGWVLYQPTKPEEAAHG